MVHLKKIGSKPIFRFNEVIGPKLSRKEIGRLLEKLAVRTYQRTGGFRG